MSPGEKEQWMEGRKCDTLHDIESLTKSKHIQEETESDEDYDELIPPSTILKPAEKAKFLATVKGYTRQAGMPIVIYLK